MTPLELELGVCELMYRYLELNLSPLQEQPVFQTTPPQPLEILCDASPHHHLTGMQLLVGFKLIVSLT